jgi:hypothetical protein
MPEAKKRRPGPGTPPGRRNDATLDKIRRLKREMAKAADDLSPDAISKMDAVQVLEFVMHSYMRSQNYSGAASIARDLARPSSGLESHP